MGLDWIDVEDLERERCGCFLPNEPSSQVLHAHIHALLDHVRDANDAAHTAMSDQERGNVLALLDVSKQVFDNPMFAHGLFPLLVEFCGLDAPRSIAVAADAEPWVEKSLSESYVSLCRLESGETTLLAHDAITGEVIPLHASALNVPLRAGDRIAARIFRTPLVNVAISVFVVPAERFDALASRMRDALESSAKTVRNFLKTEGVTLLLSSLNRYTESLLAFDGTLPSSPSLGALQNAWVEMCAHLPERAVTLDGIAPDGSLYRLVFQPSETLRLFRFRDVCARSAVLRGGSQQGSRGFTQLGWVPVHETNYADGISDFAHVVGCCSLGRDFRKVDVTERDIEQNLSTLFWVTQSLKNRAYDRAA